MSRNATITVLNINQVAKCDSNQLYTAHRAEWDQTTHGLKKKVNK